MHLALYLDIYLTSIIYWKDHPFTTVLWYHLCLKEVTTYIYADGRCITTLHPSRGGGHVPVFLSLNSSRTCDPSWQQNRLGVAVLVVGSAVRQLAASTFMLGKASCRVKSLTAETTMLWGSSGEPHGIPMGRRDANNQQQELRPREVTLVSCSSQFPGVWATPAET